MGLLDTGGFDDPNTIGLLSFGARMSNSPGGFMRGLAPSVLGALGDRGGARQDIAKQQQEQLRMQMLQAQMEEAQRKQQEQAQAQQREAQFRDYVLNNPVDTAGAQRKALELQQMKPMDFVDSLKPKARELSKLEQMKGPDGKMVNVAFYKDGSHEVLPYGVKPDIALQSLGNRMEVIDKNAVQGGQSFQFGQSPDSVASNATAMRGQNMRDSRDREQFSFNKDQAAQAVTYQTDADGNFVALPTKAQPGAMVRAAPVVAANGLAPLKGKGAGLTEDQGKATGWLVQANNAFKNMQAAMTSTPGSEKPGLNDGLAAIPSFGLTTALANTMRGTDRQKFMQGASSLSEALLRAATGAGVNKDEAIQKVRELTPVFGDSNETITQKMGAIPLYIKSLEVRAGPGAGRAESISGGGTDFAAAARAEMERRRNALKGK
ncbi:MAG: hypothetical protein Q7T97_02520 [Burkholderiaceae bacterium]|nr:hypothetical protein [Burkholderiaceae bacterium]